MKLCYYDKFSRGWDVEQTWVIKQPDGTDTRYRMSLTTLHNLIRFNNWQSCCDFQNFVLKHMKIIDAQKVLAAQSPNRGWEVNAEIDDLGEKALELLHIAYIASEEQREADCLSTLLALDTLCHQDDIYLFPENNEKWVLQEVRHAMYENAPAKYIVWGWDQIEIPVELALHLKRTRGQYYNQFHEGMSIFKNSQGLSTEELIEVLKNLPAMEPIMCQILTAEEEQAAISY